MLTITIIRELLLAHNDHAINATVDRMSSQLWPFHCQVLRRKSAVGNALVGLIDPQTGVDSVVDIVALIYDGTFLPRTDELRLDALEPGWRNGPNGISQGYLFSNEVPPGYVRLYPTPAQVVDVNIIVNVQPLTSQLIGWQRLYVALKTIDYLSTSDPVRARVDMGQFIRPFIQLIEDHVHGRDL
jgi:hypothetical protein